MDERGVVAAGCKRKQQAAHSTELLATEQRVHVSVKNSSEIHLWCRAGGNPDSNTLISDMTTVICLDDYHCLDRKGRAEKGVTALAPEAQNFDMMAEQV